MKRLSVHGQRWLKAFHIVFSSIWIGAAVSALVLRGHAGNVYDANDLQGLYSAAIFVEDLIIPSAVLTLVTGLLICGLTVWGFFKYWAVVFQIIAAIVVILLGAIWLAPAADTLKTLSESQGLLARQNGEFQSALRTAVGISVFNIIILTMTTFIAAVKPWGKTRIAKA